MSILIVLFISFGVFAWEKTAYKVFPEFTPIAPKEWCSEKTMGNWEVVMIETHEINGKDYFLFQCTFEVKKSRRK